jgi:hypothetical protein
MQKKLKKRDCLFYAEATLANGKKKNPESLPGQFRSGVFKKL